MLIELPKYQYDITDVELGKLYENPEELNNYYENTHFKTSNNKLLKLKKGSLIEVTPRNLWGISTKHNPEQTLALHDILDTDISLLAISGHAGTGKTFIALLGSLYEGRSIVFTREIEQVGKEMGYLAGDISEKFMPFMRPYFDNIDEIKKYSKKEFNKQVKLEPIQFMRGGTIRDSVIIVDEAQNCEVDVLKTIITRAGEGTKVILCGSYNQIDAKKLNKDSNGLTKVVKAFSGQKCFSYVHLLKSERSELARLADELL